MMGFFDIFHQAFSPLARLSRFNGLNECKRAEKPDVDPATGLDSTPTPIAIPDPSIRETIIPPGVPELPATSALPQRYGTFLTVDLYPGDLGGKPDWKALEANSKIGNCEVVGAILKATEGISYKWTGWFTKNGKQLREMWQPRLGQDRFMGAYHYLQLARDGRQQAEFFVRTMETINMPQGGVDLHPFLDFEQGGQNNFFPSDCPKDADGHRELHRLPESVKRDLVKRAMETTRTCAERIKELTGFTPMLYGRGLQRDLGMTLPRGYTQKQLRMGCVRVWNPAYTREIVPMDAYGWPIGDVPLWQYGGDGTAAHPKLPKGVPNFGLVDMNVHIDGPRRTSLDSFRKALVLP
jgi:hypothetical protein